MRSTATMMFGHVETDEERIAHLQRVRDVQDRTWRLHRLHLLDLSGREHQAGRFAKSPAPSIYARSPSRACFSTTWTIFKPPGSRRDRSWAPRSLAFGVNDMGSTMIEENVVASAGTAHSMNEPAIVAAIRDAGFTAKRRNMTYEERYEPTIAIEAGA